MPLREYLLKLHEFANRISFSEYNLGKIDIDSWIDSETRQVFFKFKSFIYGRDLETITIPEIKMPKNWIHSLLLAFLPKFLHFAIKWKILQKERKIVIRQYFPKLINSPRSKELHIVAADENGKGLIYNKIEIQREDQDKTIYHHSDIKEGKKFKSESTFTFPKVDENEVFKRFK